MGVAQPVRGRRRGADSGLLLGVFAYWGWESAVNLTEETRDGNSTPGRAAVWSTFVLLVTYVAVPSPWSPSPAPRS